MLSAGLCRAEPSSAEVSATAPSPSRTPPSRRGRGLSLFSFTTTDYRPSDPVPREAIEVGQRQPDRVTGPGHDEFWAYSAAGELRIQRCDAWDACRWPPTESCERCGHRQLTWEAGLAAAPSISWSPSSGGATRNSNVPYTRSLTVELGPKGRCSSVTRRGSPTTSSYKKGTRTRVAFVDCEDDPGTFRLPVFEKE